CIRTEDYLYSVYAPGVNGGEKAASDVYADDFLYDIKKDPYQLNNVVESPEYTEVKRKMRKKLLLWIKEAENAEPSIID
ncbi:MAG: arylsulfatase, partial [Lachnospiraceae bacterium]